MATIRQATKGDSSQWRELVEETFGKEYPAKEVYDQAWIEEVNGQPAIVATLHGEPYGVVLLDVRDGLVQALHAVTNPDKLRDIVRVLRMRPASE